MIYDKFRSCTVGVQAATMLYNNPRAKRAVCLHTQGCRCAPHDDTDTEDRFRGLYNGYSIPLT